MPDTPTMIPPFPASLRTARERTQAFRHLQALLASLGVQLASECPSFARGRYLRVTASHPDLSALFWLEHRLDDLGEPAGPLVHWHGASRRLRLLPGAWGSVNAFHGKKGHQRPLGPLGAPRGPPVRLPGRGGRLGLCGALGLGGGQMTRMRIASHLLCTVFVVLVLIQGIELREVTLRSFTITFIVYLLWWFTVLDYMEESLSLPPRPSADDEEEDEEAER